MESNGSRRHTAAKKAAATRRARAAGRKAALTRKRRAAARKAVATRQRRADTQGERTLTTTIQREWLREIVAGRKTVEYREIKPYWERRLADVKVPFRLRLINGMSPVAPEVTVEIQKVVRNRRSGQFELHIGRIINVRNWNRRTESPIR